MIRQNVERVQLEVGVAVVCPTEAAEDDLRCFAVRAQQVLLLVGSKRHLDSAARWKDEVVLDVWMAIAEEAHRIAHDQRQSNFRDKRNIAVLLIPRVRVRPDSGRGVRVSGQPTATSQLKTAVSESAVERIQWPQATRPNGSVGDRGCGGKTSRA